MNKWTKSDKLKRFLPSPRRSAREFAMQSLYQLELTGNSQNIIAQHVQEHIEKEKLNIIGELKDNIAQIRVIQEDVLAGQSDIHSEQSEQLTQEYHQLMQQLEQDLQETIAKLNQIQQSVYELYEKLFFGANRHREQYLEMIRPVLDRDVNALNPIERSILLMAIHELSAMPETPYKVVINEAIELTKTFGGTDSHKYVNSILDKLVGILRPNEPKGKPVNRSKSNKK